jgi:predicted dinucleotide-binding enzyme
MGGGLPRFDRWCPPLRGRRLPDKPLKRGEIDVNIGVLGSGEVAKSLAAGFLAHRHKTLLGTRNPANLKDWAVQNPNSALGSFAEAARFGELVVLAVKGAAAADALRAADRANLTGKVVIDTTNPIADAPPTNGVLKFFTSLDESLMERLQREFAGVRFVKAFKTVKVTPPVSSSHGVRPCPRSIPDL